MKHFVLLIVAMLFFACSGEKGEIEITSDYNPHITKKDPLIHEGQRIAWITHILHDENKDKTVIRLRLSEEFPDGNWEVLIFERDPLKHLQALHLHPKSEGNTEGSLVGRTVSFEKFIALTQGD